MAPEERVRETIDQLLQHASRAVQDREAMNLFDPARLSDLRSEEWQDIPESEYDRYLPRTDKWKEKYNEQETLDTAESEELPDGWILTTIGYLLDEIQTGPFVSSLHKSSQYKRWENYSDRRNVNRY